MAFIQSTDSTRINSTGADGISREQIVRYTGYAVGATVVVGSVGVMTVVAPAQIALAAGVTAGCTVAANRMRDGKSPIPGLGQSGDTQPIASVTAPSVTESVAV